MERNFMEMLETLAVYRARGIIFFSNFVDNVNGACSIFQIFRNRGCRYIFSRRGRTVDDEIYESFDPSSFFFLSFLSDYKFIHRVCFLRVEMSLRETKVSIKKKEKKHFFSSSCDAYAFLRVK